MLYCKGCECIIVPGRAFLMAGGYYCPHCAKALCGEYAVPLKAEQNSR